MLERLRLDHNASAADIRRAYARELKLVDQQHDLAGFQRLREAYEAAMEWVRHGTAAPAPVADGIAAAVVAKLSADLPALCSGGAAMVRDALESALADDALHDLNARIELEERLVALLAAGWQPGHELLLQAAAAVFDWYADPRQLRAFGWHGARVSRAIDEYASFCAQDPDRLQAQWSLLDRLHQGVVPGDGELLRSIDHLDALETSFPTWLALTADGASIARWRELESQVQDWRRDYVKKDMSGKVGGVEGVFGLVLRWAIACYVALVLLGRLLPSPLPPVEPEVAIIPNRAEAPAPVALVPLANDLVVPPELPYSPKVGEINERIRYQAPPQLSGQLRVMHIVELDARGRIIGLQAAQRSSDPYFDEAVAEAIRASGPWAPGVPRKFSILFSR